MLNQDQEHLADVSDMATLRESQFLEAALENCRNQKELAPKGECYFCGAPVEGKFCDSDCASDYSKEQRMRKIGGLRE